MDDVVLPFLTSLEHGDEAAVVHTYRLYIHERAVTVNAYDHGEDAGNQRYSVEAYWEGMTIEERRGLTGDGTGYTFGNPEGDLRMALMNAHWNTFQPSR